MVKESGGGTCGFRGVARRGSAVEGVIDGERLLECGEQLLEC